MGLEWFNENGKSGYRIAQPKAFDIIDSEPYPKKKLRIQNNLPVPIVIGQRPSDWYTVNFVIEPDEQLTKGKNVKWLATLEPTDIIEMDFKDPKDQKIEP